MAETRYTKKGSQGNAFPKSKRAQMTLHPKPNPKLLTLNPEPDDVKEAGAAYVRERRQEKHKKNVAVQMYLFFKCRLTC